MRLNRNCHDNFHFEFGIVSFFSLSKFENLFDETRENISRHRIDTKPKPKPFSDICFKVHNWNLFRCHCVFWCVVTIAFIKIIIRSGKTIFSIRMNLCVAKRSFPCCFNDTLKHRQLNMSLTLLHHHLAWWSTNGWMNLWRRYRFRTANTHKFPDKWLTKGFCWLSREKWKKKTPSNSLFMDGVRIKEHIGDDNDERFSC